MTVTDMRVHIANRYSPVIRGQRVDRMPERQVVAIYRSLLDRRDSGLHKQTVPKRNILHEPEKFEQLEMDFGEGGNGKTA